jgi:NADH dehydrogenase
MLQTEEIAKKRIVIAGAGFAGLKLARKLIKTDFEIILLDKLNFHQFQPLFYQVASCGLEPSSISFPLRKIFKHSDNIKIRLCDVERINHIEKKLITSIGEVSYDFLVLAQGTDTNFFGMSNIRNKALSMKSTPEAIQIRNVVLKNFEDAVNTQNDFERTGLMNIAIVGGGPTGVELAGALSEMRKYVLPKDFPELDFTKMEIYLLEAGNALLSSMSLKAQNKVKKYLKHLGVNIMLNATVKDFDGNYVFINDIKILAKTLIWTAGVTGNKIEGLDNNVYVKGNRIITDQFNKVEGYPDIFAIGDISYMIESNYPVGHPQVAQVAIQQADNLAENLMRLVNNKPLKPFKYKDLGTMATVGRNLAVVDLKKVKFTGTLAWLFWLFVHLMAIVGVKNRVFVFINWVVNYFTYDQSLRLIFNLPDKKKNQ